MLIAVAAALPAYDAAAQTGSTNSYSPYSMFGIGELSTQGSLPMRSMGGVGVAWRSSSVASLLNPAGYSATARKSMIFNFGAEGMHIDNTQKKYAADGSYTGLARGAKNSANFHDISLQIPLAKGLGLGISLTPYSSVGYNMTVFEGDEGVWGDVGRVRHSYSGEGDITEVKLGVGWEFVKGLSAGVAAMYYWGDIDRSYGTAVVNNVTGMGSFSSTVGNDNYSVSNVKFQAGVQYNIISNSKRMLTVGATYDLGGSLKPKITRTVYNSDLNSTDVVKEKERGQIRLPEQWAGGIFYKDARWAAGVDYVYRNWSGHNRNTPVEIIFGGMEVGYVDTHTIKAGIEFTPNRFDVRSYFSRMSYRAGFRLGDYYQSFGGEKLGEYAVTMGIGFPVKFLGSSYIDFGLEYGGRGSHKKLSETVGLVKQQYFKIAIGISMFGTDDWFVRFKYD
ncbi:MAG: hypothetical protein J1E04_02465 [Alistipes sp.]|nr:hypothetical protein [Alistipes sp.]